MSAAAAIFAIKKFNRHSCQAARCKAQFELELPGDLWREAVVKLCTPHAEQALAFAEANPDYDPPKTVYTPAERAELQHLQGVSEAIQLKSREGQDVLDIVEKSEITTQQELARANEWLHWIKDERKNLAQQKKELVDPTKLLLSRIEALFKPAEQFWADAELLQRRKIELAKLGEQENNERALQEAQAAIQAGDEAGTVAAIAKITHVSELDGLTVTERWDFEVVDESVLDRKYMRPDLSLLKIYCKKFKPDEVPDPVDGVRFFKDAGTVVRG